MPQTREHVAIIDLLGVETGIVAITKTDLVEAEMVELVRDEVEELLAGTSIEGAECVAVSAKAGTGLDELLAAIDRAIEHAHAGQASLPMRLPVDRVFTIAGAGTVVTGTMWSGSAARDDRVEVLPSGIEARVRGVQVHSEQVDRAVAGQRVALNLAGIEKRDIARGDVVAAPDTLSITDRFDVVLTLLASEEEPLESDTRVHVHHGTRDVVGRVLLMDGDRLQPGETALAQLRLDAPLAPRYGDRFVIRSFSPVWTIGGGEILDVHPPRRTRPLPAERALLEALREHAVDEAAVLLVRSRGLPMGSAEVAATLGVSRSDVADALNASDLARVKAGGETRYVSQGALDAYLAAVEERLLAFHEAEPSATSLAKGALRDRIDARLDPKVFDALLELAAERGSAVVEGGGVRHPKAAASALADEEAARDAIAKLLAAQGLAPGSPAELASEAGVEAGVARKVLNALSDDGEAVRVASELYFSGDAIAAARERITAFLGEHDTMLAKEARDLLGTSRKYVVPLLEYFDTHGLTKRDGDVRVLRESG
jgi:selenocysteine-specific elongation factor